MEDASQEPWTVLRLLNWTKEYFTREGVDSPRLCAEMLLAHVLQTQRIQLYARGQDIPDDAQRSKFRELVRRAGAGEPVAYLVGSKEFYSLRFEVTPDVLIPRPETELLVDLAVEELKAIGRAGQAWDVGTGSGCVAVAIASNTPAAMVLATDISPQAVEIARRNAAANNLAERVVCAEADLATLPAAWPGEPTFDVLVSNPPYIALDEPIGPTVKHEPDLALYGGAEGLDLLGPLIAQAPGVLKPGGLLGIEIGFTQAEAVADLLGDTGAFEMPDFILDHQQIERIVVVRKRS
jgi:release factor glutamine methyltransferase